MIKNLLTVYLFSVTLFFLSCESTQTNVSKNQVESLTANEIANFKHSIIRHVGRKPEDASLENKFHAYFDEHYDEQVKIHDLTHFYNSVNKTYFVITRIAPSIALKRVAIGGYVVFDTDSNVVSIKEDFRTWKLEPDTLLKRSDLLFHKMIHGESLVPYYTENSGNTDYIEFPNNEVWYDTITFSWKSSREDVLKEFMDAKTERTKEKIEAFENKN